MNYIDYIIIIVLVIAAVKGATKGFVYEVASLVALIGGVWGAIKFSGATETYLTQRLDFTSQHIDVIAFIITFLIIIVLVHLVGKAVEKALKSVALGPANRILGLVFSVFKTAFILGIIVVLIDKIDESLPIVPEDHIQESKFYDPLRVMAVNTFPFIQGFYDDIKDKTDEIKDSDIFDKSEPESDDEEENSKI
ncbi:MAG: CvpA family protein [Prolixibacteraceae bacterium]|jgi:membrane protein required for colicin V production|nr:CvpA family protein [Prolixibacteraceae bacterium]